MISRRSLVVAAPVLLLPCRRSAAASFGVFMLHSGAAPYAAKAVHFDGNETKYEHGIKLTELELCMEQKVANGLDTAPGMAGKIQGSIKKDDNKYDPTMLTIEMVELVSKVRMFGAKKYARGNFKITGFKYTRSLAAALRHIFAYLSGEDNDPESGLSHLGHAICSIEHCIYDSKHHPENDDRKS